MWVYLNIGHLERFDYHLCPYFSDHFYGYSFQTLPHLRGSAGETLLLQRPNSAARGRLRRAAGFGEVPPRGPGGPAEDDHGRPNAAPWMWELFGPWVGSQVS